MISPIQIKAATPQISPNPVNIATDSGLPTGAERLFDVVTILKKDVSDPTERKKRFWQWLSENGLSGSADYRELIFCNMSPEEFCAKHPEHPACKPIEPPKYPDISIWPTFLNFGEVEPYETPELATEITNVGQETLHIYNTRILGGAGSRFSISSGGDARNLSPGDSYNLWVMFTPFEEGDYADEVEILSDDPDTQFSYVYLQGTCKEPTKPKIDVSPTLIDFEQVKMYTWVYKEAKIDNIGTENLIVSSITLGKYDKPHFDIYAPNLPWTITPGVGNIFITYFGPVDTEEKIGTVYIKSNDPNLPIATITLKGQGIM